MDRRGKLGGSDGSFGDPAPLRSWKRCQVPEDKSTPSLLFTQSLTSSPEHRTRGEEVAVREQGRSNGERTAVRAVELKSTGRKCGGQAGLLHSGRGAWSWCLTPGGQAQTGHCHEGQVLGPSPEKLDTHADPRMLGSKTFNLEHPLLS